MFNFSLFLITFYYDFIFCIIVIRNLVNFYLKLFHYNAILVSFFIKLILIFHFYFIFYQFLSIYRIS